MNPRMYIFLNKGLGMSTGKAAAQAAHAACEATLLSAPGAAALQPFPWDPGQQEMWDAWRLGLHYTKIVLEVDNSVQMLVTERYLTERGIKCKLIIDEGRTEDTRFVPTAIGCALVDKDDPHTYATFESFRTYREARPSAVPDDPTKGLALDKPSYPRWFKKLMK